MSKNHDLQHQIDDLQVRLSHQEELLDTLNTIVTQQDTLIVQLQSQLQQGQKKLDDLVFSQDTTTDEKPPHY